MSRQVKNKEKPATTLAVSSSPTSVVSSPLTSSTELVPPLLAFPQQSSHHDWPVLPASHKSLRTTNPIRAIVDPIVAKIQSGSARGDGKDHISLALGDPTAAGNLPPCPVAMQAIRTTLESPHAAAGYVNACGLPVARQAIATFHNNHNHGLCNDNSSRNHHHRHSTRMMHSVSSDDVIIANGCSGALELALTALLDEGSVLLVPQPGFPLYQVIAESHGARVVPYRLFPDRHWQCDLEHLQEIMLEHGPSVVRGIVVNNPSNPTGAVFSQEHLQDIVHFCEQYQLPIVADEVYGDLTFTGHVFYPLAHVAAARRTVPVITASGIGKQYLLPGWRVGWIVFHDNVYGSLRNVQAGAKRLAQVVLGASHLVQTAIPALLLSSSPPSSSSSLQQSMMTATGKEVAAWKAQLRETLEQQACFICEQLDAANGLQVLKPGGAMYTIVRIDTECFDETIQNDVDFSKLLLKEENVFVLPGSCFGVANAFRAVFCAPKQVLKKATDRICQFCERHTVSLEN